VPVTIATAPGRAGIIGNPSDIYGGTVVSCSVAPRARVVVRPAEERRWEMCGQAAVLDGPDWTRPDPRLPLLDLPKAVWRFVTRGGFPWRDQVDCEATFSLAGATDVPMYSGFAGSTAMVAAALGALLRYFGIELNLHELAEQVRAAEFDEMAVTCGFQDSYMTVFGGLNCVDSRDKALPRAEPERPYATVEPLAHLVPHLPFVLANTGQLRNSGEVHSGPRRRFEAREAEVIAGFDRVGELGRLGKKALLRGH
jgi:galactokinase